MAEEGAQLSERDRAALEAAEGMGLAPDKATTGQEPAPGAEPGAQEGQNQPAQGSGAGAGQEPAKPIEVNTPFGKQVIGAQVSEEVLSSWDDIRTYAKENGVELNDANDIKQLFGVISELKQKAEAVPTLEATVNQFKSQLGGLPPEVANIVDAAVSGKDYKSLIKNVAAGADFDLTKDFSEHSTINVIRKYVNPEFTQEQYEALDAANKSALETLAKSKYETDQIQYRSAVADKAHEKEAYQQKFSESVNKAITVLKQTYPDMSDEHIKVVADRMQVSLRDALFNPDNTYKEDAGIRIAMQEFGADALAAQKQTIGDLAKQIESRIQSQTHESLLGRSDKPDTMGRQAVQDKDQIAKAVDNMTGFLDR